jgi:hypothetical protein
MPRRRHYAISHTRSDYCVFASSTSIAYLNRCPPLVTSTGDKQSSHLRRQFLQQQRAEEQPDENQTQFPWSMIALADDRGHRAG